MDDLSYQNILHRIGRYHPRTLKIDDMGPRAAVAAILRPRSDMDWELLFIKRAKHEEDPWSGHMAFPGGRVDPEDASALETAIRETREEIDIDLSQSARLIGRLDDLQAMARGRRLPMIIRPFVFLLEHDSIPMGNEEVDDIVWISLSWLLSGQGRGSLEYDYHGTVMELPCIRFEHYQIWGLTYHMLSGLLEILRPTGEQPSAP